MHITLDCHGKTSIGRVRSSNEDNFLVADLTKSMRVQGTSAGLDQRTRLFGSSQGKLLAVADGLGGHESGERASELAIDTIARHVLNELDWASHKSPDPETAKKRLTDALQACHARIHEDVEETPQSAGMGTTVTLAYISWPNMYVAHVGDSRCYLLRDAKLQQITRDHTMAQLQEDGEPQPDVEIPAPPEHVLWNVIGGTLDDLEPETHVCELKVGDVVLLCTDGLTRHVSDRRIGEQLGERRSVEFICSQLLKEANELGGRDNVTAIVARLTAGHEEDSLSDLNHFDAATTELRQEVVDVATAP